MRKIKPQSFPPCKLRSLTTKFLSGSSRNFYFQDYFPDRFCEMESSSRRMKVDFCGCLEIFQSVWFDAQQRDYKEKFGRQFSNKSSDVLFQTSPRSRIMLDQISRKNLQCRVNIIKKIFLGKVITVKFIAGRKKEKRIFLS